MKNLHIKAQLHNTKATLYTKFFWINHQIRAQVLCSSFKGRQYSDSPRIISEMLHDLHPEIEIIWALNSDEDPYGIVPPYVKKVKYNSKKFYQALAQSFCFISNNEMRPNIAKRKGQFFVQTWHGDRGFKKVMYDDLTDWTDIYRANVIKDNELTDICLAGSDFGEKVYRSAFRYSGNILKVGLPRNDKLLNYTNEELQKIRKNLGIVSDCKIIMYAPTFRDDKMYETCEIVDIGALVEWLNSVTGNNWFGLYRAHSLGKGIGSKKNVLDVSQYPDMADLLLISDAVITDYSSVAGDYMLMDRPMIIASFDIDDYINNRKLYASPEEVGFQTAKNIDELQKLLLDSIKQNRLIGREKAMNYYGVAETGHSTSVVVDLIVQKYEALFN